MRVAVAIVAMCFFVLCPVRALAVSSDLPPQVYFEEVMWAGSDRSTSDEWFELKSNVDTVLALDGWRIDGAGSKTIDLSGQQIPAHGSLLVAHFDVHHTVSSTKKSVLAIDADVLQSSITLSNSVLQLRLYRNDELIDVAGNGSTPLKGSSKSGALASMERLLPLGAGDLATSWQTATTVSHVDRAPTIRANPNHAGRPAIQTTLLPVQPAQTIVPIEIQVTDPDGEDSISSVSLDCVGTHYELVDTGLAGDRIAGDRTYTALVQTGRETSQACDSLVQDMSGLYRQQSFNLETYVADADVSINELYPMPNVGEDEYIELLNSSDVLVSLNGWQLDDQIGGGSPPFALDGYVIEPYGYLVLHKSETGIALNDDGDHAVLTTPLGTVKSDVVYAAAKRGESWGLYGESWGWEVPTPGKVNTPSVPLNGAPSTFPIMDVQQFCSLAPSSQAQLSGEVVALPGMLGSQYFLLADGTGTMQVYLYNRSFPALELGETVTIQGTRSSTTYPRLILQNGSAVARASNSLTISPRALDQVLQEGDSAASYVSGKATVVKRNDRSLELKVGDRTLSVAWPATDSSSTFDSAIATDDTVSVVGIVTKSDTNEPQLTIRSASDVSIEIVPSIVVSAVTNIPSVPKAVVRLVSTHVLANVQPLVRNELTTVQQLLNTLSVRVGVLDLSVAEASIQNQLAELDVKRWIRFDECGIVFLLTTLAVVTLLHEVRRTQLLVPPINSPRLL